MGRDDAYDAKTGKLSTIRDDPESIKARDSDGALVLVTHVAPTYVRSWAIPAAEAEDIVKEEAKKKSDYFLRMQTLLHESKAVKE